MDGNPSPFGQSQWIQPADLRLDNEASLVNSWYVARRSFSLSADQQALTLSIAADSKYWLYLNGALIIREGGLKRGPTPGDTYFDHHILTEGLRSGTNQLAILLWHFGRDGFSHKNSGSPGLLVEITDAKGRSVFSSHHPWKMRRHPAFSDAGYLRDGFRLPESGICFDARRDLGNWTSPSYHDAEWPEAAARFDAGSGPWGALFERPIPPWRWSEPRVYDHIDVDPSEGEYTVHRCTISHEAFFVPILDIGSTPPGLRIDCYVASSTNCLIASYITRSGPQTFEGFGWLAGHEVIYRVPKAVRLRSLGYRETGYGAHFAGFFHSDDFFLNRLWRKSRRTLYMTMRDTFMDCPCRERAQWPGDFVVQLAQVPYCLSRSADQLIRKAILEFAQWQRTDGTLFGPLPAGNWEQELPSQMLSILSRFGVWTYYQNTGDAATLRQFYPAMKRYLSLWKTGPDGLIEYRKGGWDWLDWGRDFDSHALLSLWHILALEGAEFAAKALGYSEDARAFAEQAHIRRHAMRAICWNGESFRHPLYEGEPDDRTQALAILSGTALPAHWPALHQCLIRHRQASPYMERYVLEALIQIGELGDALARLRDRFNGMANTPGTTLWEVWPEWESSSLSTWCHSWSGGPLVVMSRYLAGFSPLDPGWTTFQIRPQPGADLKHISASIELAGGPASLRFQRRDDESVILHIRVPFGSRALFNPEGLMNGGLWDMHANREGLDTHVTTNTSLWLETGQWTITLNALKAKEALHA